MIPAENFTGSTAIEQPSLTFEMDSKQHVRGTCDNIDAIKQAIYLILSVERYTCPIVSWDYGVELVDLIGQPLTYCVPQIEKRIREALIQDDRITRVYDFEFDVTQKGIVTTKFKVDTTAGTVEIEKGVTV